MADLILECGTNDFIIDADQSSVTINSLNDISLSSASGKTKIDGAIQFMDLASGFLSLDSSGNASAVAGDLFSTSSPYTVTGAWTHSAAVQVNSTLGVTGTATLGGIVINTGIVTQASTLGIPSFGPPAGYSYLIINNTTKEIRQMV